MTGGKKNCHSAWKGKSRGQHLMNEICSPTGSAITSGIFLGHLFSLLVFTPPHLIYIPNVVNKKMDKEGKLKTAKVFFYDGTMAPLTDHTPRFSEWLNMSHTHKNTVAD